MLTTCEMAGNLREFEEARWLSWRNGVPRVEDTGQGWSRNWESTPLPSELAVTSLHVIEATSLDWPANGWQRVRTSLVVRPIFQRPGWQFAR